MIRKIKHLYFFYDYYCYYILLPLCRYRFIFITITERKKRTGTYGLRRLYYDTIRIIYKHIPEYLYDIVYA